jgi:D-aminopeptidase
VAEEEIYKEVKKAVNRIEEMKPFIFTHPVLVEIRFKRVVQALKAKIRRKGWRFAGVKRIRTKLPSMLDWKC